MTGSMAPYTEGLVALIAANNPMQGRALQAARARMLAEEVAELEGYLAFCHSEGLTLQTLADAYQTITMDTLREQVYFQRNGRYRYSTFREVADKVYFDPAYMSKYMYGLAMTLYLWPNHLEIARFFWGSLPRSKGGRYLEIGPGHGVFFRHAARSGGFDLCTGVDISPTSLEMTRRLLTYDRELPPDRWQLVNADFLAAESLQGGFEAIVMGEVLEHVEEPLSFLVRISELMRPDAYVFVTTAVNAPAVDHIYLFRSVDEVIEMARQAGLGVRRLLATPYKGCSMEDTVAQKLPINVAMVLGK
jgi:2-polyprenyl-3-methyl-5-hydroxy-6-metoxy-1,4-benzoquinol methylase